MSFIEKDLLICRFLEYWESTQLWLHLEKASKLLLVERNGSVGGISTYLPVQSFHEILAWGRISLFRGFSVKFWLSFMGVGGVVRNYLRFRDSEDCLSGKA